MTNHLKEKMIKAQQYLEHALAKEELFWMENARTRQHKHGDRNTSYFHRVTKIKSSRNKITCPRDGDILISDPTKMDAHAVYYYSNIFGFTGDVQNSNLTDII